MLQHLALLAQIELSPEKEENLLEDLNHILKTFETISRVPEPPKWFSLGNTPLREDKPILEALSSLIPADRSEQGYVVVRRTLEE